MLALGWWHLERYSFHGFSLPSFQNGEDILLGCGMSDICLHSKGNAVSFLWKPEWEVWEQWSQPGEMVMTPQSCSLIGDVPPGKSQKLLSPNSGIQVYRGLMSLKCFHLEKIVFLLSHKSEPNTFKWHQDDHLLQYSLSGLMEKAAWCGHMTKNKTQVSDSYSWTLWLNVLRISSLSQEMKGFPSINIFLIVFTDFAMIWFSVFMSTLKHMLSYFMLRSDDCISWEGGRVVKSDGLY